MQLHFLGRGAAFNPLEGNNSAYIMENDRLLLIDCGETVFETLVKKGILEKAKTIDVLISHLHGDHCGSIGTLVLYAAERLRIPLNLVPPDEPAYREQIVALLRLLGCREGMYEIILDRELTGYASFDSVRYVRTGHAPGMLCHSFVFETPEGGVFYSADTNDVAPLQAFLREHPTPEHIYLEAAYPAASVHLSLDVLDDVVPSALRSVTSLMHIGSQLCMDQAIQRGFQIVSVD
ncbi:MAG: MBL fold metallo-hydrolase [Clostridia bacterium]|nr:MBL fold metallo-hydrolase [Clostridia bacterium]